MYKYSRTYNFFIQVLMQQTNIRFSGLIFFKFVYCPFSVASIFLMKFRRFKTVTAHRCNIMLSPYGNIILTFYMRFQTINISPEDDISKFNGIKTGIFLQPFPP